MGKSGAIRGVTLAMTALLACLSLAHSRPSGDAFDDYISRVENRINVEHSSTSVFLELHRLPEGQSTDILARLHRGEVVVTRQNNSPIEVPGGLIHDWRGDAFIPNATIDQVIALVSDYNHLARYYSPYVVQSRLISGQGDDLQVTMRLREHKVITVVLDTAYDIHYGRLDHNHQYSNSHSTRVAEIANPGQPDEHALTGADDHGFMWRLNTYWSFEQLPDGVLVECEAISLSRDIPAGLGWLISPIVESIPRESLEFTLNGTRAALARR